MSNAEAKRRVTVHPGQKLRVWGWAYSDSCKERREDPEPQALDTVAIALVDHTGKSRRVGSATPRGSDGTFSTTVTIPESAALGKARLTDDNPIVPGRLQLTIVKER